MISGTGIGVFDPALLQAINAQAELMVDPIKGFMAQSVMTNFMRRIDLRNTDPGYRVAKLSQGRIVSKIPKGGPYPRITRNVQTYFLETVKMGGRMDIYEEDVIGISEDLRTATTAGTFENLRDDLALSVDEMVGLALNTAVTEAKDIYDAQSGNLVQPFSMAALDKMILKLKQKVSVKTMSEYFLVIPSTLEFALRQDGAFDNAPQLKSEILLNGQLPQGLAGLGGVVVTETMPVKYDSAGNMNDATAAPTGVWKLPCMFTDDSNEVPADYREDVVAALEFVSDKCAATAWLLHKSRVGVFLNRIPDTAGGWQHVEPVKNEDDDSFGAKVKAHVNVGITDTKYFIRGENFQMTSL